MIDSYVCLWWGKRRVILRMCVYECWLREQKREKRKKKRVVVVETGDR